MALTEAFVVDLDDGMRELTFGDLAVPREIKRAAAPSSTATPPILHRWRAHDALPSRAIGTQLAYLDPGAAWTSPAVAAYVGRCAQRARRASRQR